MVLGACTDRSRPPRGTSLTLALMAVGIVTITVTPSYAAIGLAAPLIVLPAGWYRVSPPGGAWRRLGLSGGDRHARTQGFLRLLAVRLPAGGRRDGRGLGAWWLAALSPADLEAWGWRIPLSFGCLIVPLLFFMRRYLKETRSSRPRSPGRASARPSPAVARPGPGRRRRGPCHDDHGELLHDHRLHPDLRPASSSPGR